MFETDDANNFEHMRDILKRLLERLDELGIKVLCLLVPPVHHPHPPLLHLAEEE